VSGSLESQEQKLKSEKLDPLSAAAGGSPTRVAAVSPQRRTVTFFKVVGLWFMDGSPYIVGGTRRT